MLELGNLHGFRTYTADISKEYKGKKLGEIATLKNIDSPFLSKDILDIVKEIDIIWFRKEMPEFCFEVEHTTNVREGLLRLYQISPLTNVRLFIIAPSENQPKFEKEIAKAPFKEIKYRYIFKSYEELVSLYNLASRYFHLRNKFGIG